MKFLVDVHAHLHYRDFEKDIDSVIKRAKEAGVVKIINNGLDKETNRKTLALAKKYGIVEAALGLYPSEAVKLQLKDIEDELVFIESKKNNIVAVGEIGLDYMKVKEKQKQKDVFINMLDLAEKIKKPVIVHSRNAEEDAISILETQNTKNVVLHCFSGSIGLIKKAEKLGFYFSVPTNIIRSHHFQNLVKNVNISRLLTETDAPYLSPFPGKRNEPAFIAESINKIAKIKGMVADEVANCIFMNYQKVFLAG